MAADIGQGLMGIMSSYSKKDMGGVFKSGLGLIRTAGGSSQKADKWAKENRASAADVVSIFSLSIELIQHPTLRSRGVAVKTLKRVPTPSKLAKPRVL